MPAGDTGGDSKSDKFFSHIQMQEIAKTSVSLVAAKIRSIDGNYSLA
jgi:hypothetical protein